MPAPAPSTTPRPTGPDGPAADPGSVLIVGAGPTGLTLAAVLARFGITVRIVDRGPGPSEHTKATNLMQRTQELLAPLGVLPELTALSGRMRRLMVAAYGADLGPRTMHLPERSPYPDVLLCGQNRFEAVMTEELSRLGIWVEYGTALTGLGQTPDGVSATLSRDGVEQTAAAAWAVGCDGAAGTSRSFTRLGFTPQRTGVAIRQVDCRLDWRRLPDAEQMWLFYVDRGFAVVVPLPGGVHRVLTVEPKDLIPEREPTVEEMQSRLRAITGDQALTLSAPTWTSYTDLAMGLAPGLRDGHILLAGDVANPVLPNGGQGMNTGIADAYDLGWKLAAVIAHGAPDALLDTYHDERHALRAALQKAQHASLRYTTLRTPSVMRAAFRAVAGQVLDHGGEHRVALAFSELTLHTRRSPLTLDRVGRRGLRAGDRALDARVTTDGHPTTLYDQVYRGRWTLLAFTGHPTVDPTPLNTALGRLDRPDLATAVVSTGAQLRRGCTTLWDLDTEAHHVYGLAQPTLVLVRPDGHIAVRVRPDDIDSLATYIQTWVPDARQRLDAQPPVTPGLGTIAA